MWTYACALVCTSPYQHLSTFHSASLDRRWLRTHPHAVDDPSWERELQAPLHIHLALFHSSIPVVLCTFIMCRYSTRMQIWKNLRFWRISKLSATKQSSIDVGQLAFGLWVVAKLELKPAIQQQNVESSGEWAQTFLFQIYTYIVYNNICMYVYIYNIIEYNIILYQ